ncbi:hypothetical protein EHS25_002609 [Saitozyma podzolica]|uniref:Uncharacterized protein n=1 Tax=Saitozyma podzolica TaxID=1890683 RepID=A0A427YDA7_9TREE|nr:hypothetical protein EHS25_002609 [Saitozyma podzolica]
MAQSPKKESQDPLIGQSGVGQEPVGQKTDKEQRDGGATAASGTASGGLGGAVKSAQAAADALGEGGLSRKDVETGNAAQ